MVRFKCGHFTLCEECYYRTGPDLVATSSTCTYPGCQVRNPGVDGLFEAPWFHESTVVKKLSRKRRVPDDLRIENAQLRAEVIHLRGLLRSNKPSI